MNYGGASAVLLSRVALFLILTSVAPQPALADWLSSANAYRAVALLPFLTENPSWSEGCLQHSRYMVKNDFFGNTQTPGNPWSTPEGLAAAQSSILGASGSTDISDTVALDLWMQSPFLAITILNPALSQTGFGSYREQDGGIQMGACFDITRGVGPLPGTVTFPIRFPENGTLMPLLSSSMVGLPDPLSSCPGYTFPSGPPLILQLGTGTSPPTVTAHALFQGNVPLAHCLYDETSYSNPDSSYQAFGRAVLGSRNAVVLIPRDPLVPGAPYTATVTTNTQTHTWSFTARNGESPLVAAVLPGSRSVQVGTSATAFVTIINTGDNLATNVGISLKTPIPAAFRFQRTDPATNALIGAPNTLVNIPGLGFQTFVVELTPTAAFAPTEVELNFAGANMASVATIPGVNTLLLSASNTPVPDIVVLAATLNNDGIVNIPGTTGTGAFAVATSNVGAGGIITALADTGGLSLPVSLSLCETTPATGACLAAPSSSVTTQVDANETPTFGIFVQGTGDVPFNPAAHRVFVRFQDGGGATRGATSVAVRTQ
jgi:hypothetical protein